MQKEGALMHDSHKFWMTIAVFLVVTMLLVTMYFLAYSKNKELKSHKAATAQTQPQYEDTTPFDMEEDENAIPGELKSIDLQNEVENDEAIQEEA